jgi:hypothetical protein
MCCVINKLECSFAELFMKLSAGVFFLCIILYCSVGGMFSRA